MMGLPDLRRLARGNGTLCYNTRHGVFDVEKGRGLGGRFVSWLKSVFKRPHNAAGTDHASRRETIAKFVESMQSHYGAELVESLNNSKAGRRLNKASTLKTPVARQLISEADRKSLGMILPLVDALKQNPDKLDDFWHGLAQANLLTSGFVAEYMTQLDFPPNSQAEWLRGLLADGFLRSFGNPPLLKKSGGEYALAYESTTLGPRDAKAMDELFATGDESFLSPATVRAHIDAAGELDVDGFFAALSQEGRQLYLDISRDIKRTKYDILGKSNFKQPEQLLAAVWQATGKNPQQFTTLCNALTQTLGNQLYRAQFRSDLPEYRAFQLEGSQSTMQRMLRVWHDNGTLIGEASFREHAIEGQDFLTSQSSAPSMDKLFTLDKHSQFDKRGQCQFRIDAEGTLRTNSMRAQFTFSAPLKSIS